MRLFRDKCEAYKDGGWTRVYLRKQKSLLSITLAFNDNFTSILSCSTYERCYRVVFFKHIFFFFWFFISILALPKLTALYQPSNLSQECIITISQRKKHD